MEEIDNLKKENDKMVIRMKERNEQFDKKCLEFEENVEKYKYSNGKIYKMSVEGHKKFYVGSTTQTLYKRLSMHKANYKKNKHVSNHSSFILCKYAEENEYDVKIELIEAYPCKTKFELEHREGFYMELYKDKIVNHYRAGINARGNTKQYDANYRAEHKAEINKLFYCECGGRYTKANKSQHIKSIKHLNYINNKLI